MAGEKTEKATPKRKEDERKKGNVFQSSEVLSVVSLLAMFNILRLIAPLMVNILMDYTKDMFSSIAKNGALVVVEDMFKLTLDGIVVVALVAAPMLFASGLIAVIVTFAQTKMLFTMESIKPKFSKLNPLKGLKNIISIRGLVELVKSILKIAALVAIIYNTVKKRLIKFPLMFDMDLMQCVSFLSDLVFSIVNTSGAIFVMIAVGDYVYQWWNYEKNLRMSKDEIKEEYKQMEGDPQVKGKIKEKQRQMAQNRMMQAVPEADVVVRNPTHFAVALKYDSKNSQAPTVVAKGQDEIALKIVEIAEKNNVTVMENVPLARGLFAAVEIGMEIPAQFYQPVAEVLAFVYNLKNKKSIVPDEIIKR